MWPAVGRWDGAHGPTYRVRRLPDRSNVNKLRPQCGAHAIKLRFKNESGTVRYCMALCGTVRYCAVRDQIKIGCKAPRSSVELRSGAAHSVNVSVVFSTVSGEELQTNPLEYALLHATTVPHAACSICHAACSARRRHAARTTQHAPLCRYTYRSVRPSAEQAAAESIQHAAGTENTPSALQDEAFDEAFDEAPHEDADPSAYECTEMNKMMHGFTDMRFKDAAAIEEAEEDAVKKEAVQTVLGKTHLSNTTSRQARVRRQPRSKECQPSLTR